MTLFILKGYVFLLFLWELKKYQLFNNEVG